MPRLPYAALTLIEQVRLDKPRAKVEPAGDPDGFNVHRTIRFDKRTSTWLAPLLEAIEDPRIESLHVTDAGYLYVTFIAKPQADQRARFPLAAAAEVTQQ